jgi:flagellar basal body-associated protein FliL
MAQEIISGLGKTAAGAANVGIIILVGLVIIGVAVFIIWMIHQSRKWKQFEVRVWMIDAFGQVMESKDKGGIFINKITNAKRFYVKNCKADLPPDNIPIIPIGKKRIVYIRQVGQKNFEYVYPSKIYEDKALNVVSEQDVNWAINDFMKHKETFSKNSWLQYLPFIALGVVAVVIMIIFIYFFKKLDVLEAMSANFLEAAKVLNPSVIQ